MISTCAQGRQESLNPTPSLLSAMDMRAWILLLWLFVTQSALACSSGQCHSDCCSADEFCGAAKLSCSEVQMGCHLPTVQDQAEAAPTPEGPRFVIVEPVKPLLRPVMRTFSFVGTVSQPHEALPGPPPVPPPRSHPRKQQ